MIKLKHWSDDPYWTDAQEKFVQLRDEGKTHFILNLAIIEECVFNENSPAYRLMDAMVSVKKHERMDGYRGAPRILLALLVRLEELSNRI